MSDAHTIGFDLGATHIKAAVLDSTGTVQHYEQFETNDAEGAWLDRIKAHVALIESEVQVKDIGIAAPGLAARDGRTIAWMQGRLAGLAALDWTRELGRKQIVQVLNDAHAALLGEVAHGAAKGLRNAVLLTLGTGVGGAILCDGHLLHGHLGRAGHLGHLSLNPDGPKDIVNTPGSIEDAIGDHTVRQRSEGRFDSTEALISAHRAGDRSATKIWLHSVKHLAAAIASIINAVDPQVVILGGGISRAGRALFNPLNHFLDEFEWRPDGHRVRVIPAALGEWAGAIGAAWHAMDLERKEHE